MTADFAQHRLATADPPAGGVTATTDDLSTAESLLAGDSPALAGVVFDNDGLLLDTEPCWTVAETALFQTHGQ